MALDKCPVTAVKNLYTRQEGKPMSKVTESRKKILALCSNQESYTKISDIKEFVLDDENWNEPEPKIADEDKSLLDIAIDLLPDPE